MCFKVFKSNLHIGALHGLIGVCYELLVKLQDLLRELLGDSVQKSIRDESNLILLPRQLWCSIKESEDGDTMCEGGWLFDRGHAISSKCFFSSDAKLKASIYKRFYYVSTYLFQVLWLTP